MLGIFNKLFDTNAREIKKLEPVIAQINALEPEMKKLKDTDIVKKTLEFKKDKDFGNGLVRPSEIETYSPLYKGYKSFMIFQKVKARKVPDEALTLNFMSRLGELR